MPIDFAFENGILTVDIRSLSAEKIRLIKLAINYPEKIIQEDGEVVDNTQPWLLFQVQKSFNEINKRTVEIKEQEVQAQALIDSQAEIDAIRQG